MTRPKWICFLLICSLTLMVATPILAEYEYPDPYCDEEVDPDGLEGIHVSGGHQAVEGEVGRGGSEVVSPNAMRQLRNIFRAIRTIGL